MCLGLYVKEDKFNFFQAQLDLRKNGEVNEILILEDISKKYFLRTTLDIQECLFEFYPRTELIDHQLDDMIFLLLMTSFLPE